MTSTLCTTRQPAAPDPQAEQDYWLFESLSSDDWATTRDLDATYACYESAGEPFFVQHHPAAEHSDDEQLLWHDHPSLTAVERNPSLAR